MLDPSASAGESPVLARADSDVSTSSSASSDSVFSSYTNSDRRSSTASSIHPHSSSGGKPGSGPSSSELDTPIAELPGELLHAGRSRSDTNDSATSITPGSSLNGLQQAIRSLAITPSLSQSESAQNHAKSYATPSAIMKSVTPGTVGKQHKTASTGDGFPWNRASSSKGGNISGRRGSRTVQDDSSIVSTPSAIFNSGYSDFPTPSSSKVQTSPTRRSDDVKGYRATAENIEQHEEYFHQQQQQSDSSCSVDPYSSLRSTPLGKSASAGPSSPRTQSSSSSSANYKDSISAYHQQQQQQLSMAAVATISSISNNNFNPFRYSPPALAAPGGSSINSSIPASPVASLQSQSAIKHSSASTSSLFAGQDASLPSSQRSRNFSMESSSRSSTVYPAYQPPSSSGSTRPWVRDADASSVRSCGTASEGSGQEEQGETLSVMSPVAPPQIPFLASNSAPATGCKICVDASPSDHFVVVASLPGFSLDNITLALKRNGALHILADRYDQSCASSCPSLVSSSPSSANSGRGGSTGASSIASGQSSGSSACSTHSAAHFERLVELGEQAIGSKVTAEFDGKRLRMVVKKRNPGSRSGFKSSCSTRNGTSDSGHASNSRNHVGSSAFSIF